MKLTISLAMFLTISLVSSAFAENSVNETKGKDNPPIILVPNDIYVQANEPASVKFKVTVKDDFDKDLTADCDAVSGQEFGLGKTTVRCIAVDSNGNMGRNSFVVTVGYEITEIPIWTKTLVAYWTSGLISDSEFTDSMNYLIQNKIVKIPSKNGNTIYDLPTWVKTYSNWWVSGKISNDEYAEILSKTMRV